MSATVDEIYNSIATAASQEEALTNSGFPAVADTAMQLRSDVSSGSTVSTWRLFVWLFAYASKVLQDLWEAYRSETVEMAKDGHFGTRRWFVAKAKAFQFGHVLVLSDLDAGYAVDDPASRIVTHAVCVEQANTVTVKAAKAAGAGLQKLAPEEALALNAYFQQLRPPVQVVVLTADADKLKLSGTVIYDADVPLSATQAAVTLAISSYLNTLDFAVKGALRVTDLRASMLGVPGVVDVQLTTVEARSIGPFMVVGRVYYSYAGYMVIDPGSPISASMTWQAGNL